jgi:putative hydroxymethylpyrimidine transport system ATP-binding protein
MIPISITREPSPAVFIRHAHLEFGGNILFDDLNLILPAGKTTCLLGASGIGKSTLLRLIANLITPEISARENTVLRADISADNSIPLREQVAYMAQTDLLLPWLTVTENTLLGSALRGVNAAERARLKMSAQDLLQSVGLEKVFNVYPRHLSGGMRQRVALVRTLMENKPIILMDEPFSSLDTLTRFKLQTLTANLLKNRTILLVTHDPMEALRLGNEIYVMAGLPARLHAPLKLAGAVPRDPTSPALLKLQAELLRELTQTQAQEEWV